VVTEVQIDQRIDPAQMVGKEQRVQAVIEMVGVQDKLETGTSACEAAKVLEVLSLQVWEYQLQHPENDEQQARGACLVSSGLELKQNSCHHPACLIV